MPEGNSHDRSWQRPQTFAPPDVPVQVFCMHCREVYESWQLVWRGEAGAGAWCCPTAGCAGFGFRRDIWPTDPDLPDESGQPPPTVAETFADEDEAAMKDDPFSWTLRAAEQEDERAQADWQEFFRRGRSSRDNP